MRWSCWGGAAPGRSLALTLSCPPPGISNVHLPGAPPQFSNMEEMGVASSRAKRYSSQRQRAVPEPTPPMHLGVMEGHYYEPSKCPAALGAPPQRPLGSGVTLA